MGKGLNMYLFIVSKNSERILSSLQSNQIAKSNYEEVKEAIKDQNPINLCKAAQHLLTNILVAVSECVYPSTNPRSLLLDKATTAYNKFKSEHYLPLGLVFMMYLLNDRQLYYKIKSTMINDVGNDAKHNLRISKTIEIEIQEIADAFNRAIDELDNYLSSKALGVFKIITTHGKKNVFEALVENANHFKDEYGLSINDKYTTGDISFSIDATDLAKSNAIHLGQKVATLPLHISEKLTIYDSNNKFRILVRNGDDAGITTFDIPQEDGFKQDFDLEIDFGSFKDGNLVLNIWIYENKHLFGNHFSVKKNYGYPIKLKVNYPLNIFD